MQPVNVRTRGVIIGVFSPDLCFIDAWRRYGHNGTDWQAMLLEAKLDVPDKVLNDTQFEFGGLKQGLVEVDFFAG